MRFVNPWMLVLVLLVPVAGAFFGERDPTIPALLTLCAIA